MRLARAVDRIRARAGQARAGRRPAGGGLAPSRDPGVIPDTGQFRPTVGILAAAPAPGRPELPPVATMSREGGA
jgi:hypothetical protein